MKGFRLQILGYSLILYLLFAVTCPLSTIFASESTSSAQIGSSRINPTSPLYFLKTIRESIETKLALTDNVRDLRQLEFATRRLREAKGLVGKNEDLIPSTLERYSSHLHILKSNFEKRGEQLGVDINNNLSVHLQVLLELHSKAITPRAKIAIRAAINRIILAGNIPIPVKKPVCSFLEEESSSSALSKTEQYVLGERSQACFKSLL